MFIGGGGFRLRIRRGIWCDGGVGMLGVSYEGGAVDDDLVDGGDDVGGDHVDLIGGEGSVGVDGLR